MFFTFGRSVHALIFIVFASLWLVFPLVAQAQDNYGLTRFLQDRQEDARLSDQGQEGDLRQEVQPLVEVVAAAVNGQFDGVESSFAVEHDFLKGVEGETYVPYTLILDPSQITTSSVAMYIMVTEHAAVPEGEVPTSEEEQSLEPVFEDAYLIALDTSEMVAHRISRSVALQGGEYDVYIALRGTGELGESEELATVLLSSQQLSVPDFWNDQFATSTVIVAANVEPIAQELSPAQQLENPYTIGTTRIIPVTDSLFSRTEELALVFIVYNPSLDSDNKPDVTVEYSFNTQTADGEEYFNRTSPQNFNAQTLPPSFDLTAGHQLVAGQTVPLSIFPEGTYRLEIDVTDNASGASVAQDVMFTVEQP